MAALQRIGAIRACLLSAPLVSLISGVAGLAGCAHVAAPAGGPPDSIPPQLVLVQPDSYSVNPGFDGEVRFEFDETISEQGVQQAATIYPFELRPRIKKGKREVKVRPREGWVADRIYHLRVEPVVQDLFNNRIEEPIPFIFSTGLDIPTNLAQGTVFDRITARPLAGGRVDFVLLPDTLRYGGEADSIGEFRLATLPAGEYLAIGYEDLNGNRRADDLDRADTTRLNLGVSDTLDLVFQVFRHDTVGPILAQAQAVDSLIVELSFDGYLDPDSVLAVRQVELRALPDSQPIAIDTILHAWQYTAWRDSVQAALQARQDSLAALADSLAALADTLAAEPDTLGVEPDTLGLPPDMLRADSLALQPVAAIDTAQAIAPAPERRAEQALEATPPARAEERGEGEEEGEQEEVAAEEEEPAALPDRSIYVVAAQPIPPGTVVVIVQGIFNISGFAGGGEVSYEQPAPPEPEEEEPAAEEPPGEPPPGEPPPGEPRPAGRLAPGRLWRLGGG